MFVFCYYYKEVTELGLGVWGKDCMLKNVGFYEIMLVHEFNLNKIHRIFELSFI